MIQQLGRAHLCRGNGKLTEIILWRHLEQGQKSTKTRKCAPTQKEKKKATILFTITIFHHFLFAGGLWRSQIQTFGFACARQCNKNTHALTVLHYVKYNFWRLAVHFGTQLAKEAHIKLLNFFFFPSALSWTDSERVAWLAMKIFPMSTGTKTNMTVPFEHGVLSEIFLKNMICS